MRITRSRDLHTLPGYFNPETHAQKHHADCSHYDNTRISRADAYRHILDAYFAPYAWPGGYPIVATTDAGDILCPTCARTIYLNERLDVTVDCYFEGPTLFCDECNDEMESAYGDPEDNDNDASDN